MLWVPCYNFSDLWAVHSSIALLQFHCVFNISSNQITISLTFRTEGSSLAMICVWHLGWFLQLPCYKIIDLWIVSSSPALLQPPWPSGCKLFICRVANSSTFGLYVLPLHWDIFNVLWVASSSIWLLQCPWISVCNSSIVSLQVPWRWSVMCSIALFNFIHLSIVNSSIAWLQVHCSLGYNFLNCLATVSLTFGL